MLFQSIIYGPIHSRRLGTSLGVELMPLDHKLCSFNCVYCECGWNTPVSHPKLPTREQVREALETKLKEIANGTGEAGPIDVITFSGNGEPTMHPDFLGIIQDTLKLDAGTDTMMRRIDLPINTNLTVEQITQWLAQFNGDFTLQTCFLKGEHNGEIIDNTTDEELTAWYRAVETLRPKQIMIYVIDRKTPEEHLSKISREQMEAIAAPLIDKGFNVSISA